MKNMTASEVIESLGMQPLPVEGGYFAVTHLSHELLKADCLAARYKQDRRLSGAIYYLVTGAQFSAIHKLPTDELYYYHYGAPLELWLFGPKGQVERKVVGMEFQNGQSPQALAPAGWWQGSRPLENNSHDFSLVSTSMSPAYEQTDPEFGKRKELVSTYPEFADTITVLTRS